MRTWTNNAGWWGLLEGVYHRAVLDYYCCLISNNKTSEKELTKFFLNCPYRFDADAGKFIMERARRELRKAENFIIDYITEESESIIIPKDVNIECIRELLRLRYKMLSIRLLNAEVFNSPLILCKKGR